MPEIHPSRILAIAFSLCYASQEAEHEDRWLAPDVNFRHNILPPGMDTALADAAKGSRVGLDYAPGQGLPPYDEQLVHPLEPGQFTRVRVAGRQVPPLEGRFYPRGLLQGVAGLAPQDLRPFRLINDDEDALKADLNHPLSLPAQASTLRLEAEVLETLPEAPAGGGDSFGRLEQITDFGPGMQCRYKGRPTTFCDHYPMRRREDGNDTGFYQEPRMVSHIDALASAMLGSEYARRLAPGMRVLDLMSSIHSHLPRRALNMDLDITGLGLNNREMEANPFLSRHVVQDLNVSATLPFPDQSMDAALCSLSLEYLRDPLAVLAETARVLRPGGQLMAGFSDRWFPTKVALCWPDLHPFERMGLVLEWFMQTGLDRLWTLSMRNWPRPSDDAHYPDHPGGDPVFMVGGSRP